MERSAEVEQAVRTWLAAISRRDAAAVGEQISRDENALVIGTDPDEWWSGHDRIVELFAKQLGEFPDDFSVSTGDITAAAEGNAGWAAGRASFHLGETEVPARFTTVLRREDDGWKLVHIHASIGAANEETIGQELTTG